MIVCYQVFDLLFQKYDFIERVPDDGWEFEIIAVWKIKQK